MKDEAMLRAMRPSSLPQGSAPSMSEAATEDPIGMDLKDVMKAVMAQNSMLKRELADLKKKVEDSNKEKDRGFKEVRHLLLRRRRREREQLPLEQFQSFLEGDMGDYMNLSIDLREIFIKLDGDPLQYLSRGLELFRQAAMEGETMRRKSLRLHTMEPQEGLDLVVEDYRIAR
ncbi:unnamed protein product [Durusdinium trenchii]